MTVVYDIETLKECFTYSDFNIETKEVNQFVIHKDRKELLKLVNYLKLVKRQIGFNNLAFDSQVIQYILNNYWSWIELSGSQIAEIIWEYAQIVIERANNQNFVFSEFPEWKLDILQLDLFKVLHFDNQAKMTSLKWVEYAIDFHNVQDMPIKHDEKVREEDIKEILSYNLNDVMATYELYKICIGDTELPLYKGIDKIALRKDIKKQFGLNLAINFNDVKIGDRINQFEYCKESGIDKKEIPKPTATTSFTFKDCFPKYIKFESLEFNNFIKLVGKEEVKLKKETKNKQEFKFTFNFTNYVMARGGLHSEDKPRIVIPKENELLRDADIGSHYPNYLRKNKVFPKHLGEAWLKGYINVIEQRLEAKDKYKKTKDKKYQSIQEAYKLALNGGGFGKLNDFRSWQYDPFACMCVTIGGQIDLLMLIEDFELAGIHVISANTDGVVALFDKSLEDKYNEICLAWEKQVGNDVLGKLEYSDYNKLIQTSVNDYIAIKGNEIKQKGDFVTEFELHKNKSRRIVPIALNEYFVKGTPIIETIKNHKNIFDFCLGVKAKGTKLIALSKEGEEELGKIVRYYISNQGVNLLKRLKPLKKGSNQLDIFGGIDDGTREHEVEAGWLSTIYNKHIDQPIENYDINYEYYINACNRIIEQIK